MILKLYKLIRDRHTIGKPPKKRGQRVVLMPNAPGSADDDNPKYNSTYYCEGTVGVIGRNSADVRWDNGRSHLYNVEFLRVVPYVTDKSWTKSKLDEDNPNVTFRVRAELMYMKEKMRELLEGRNNPEPEQFAYATYGAVELGQIDVSTSNNMTWG